MQNYISFKNKIDAWKYLHYYIFVQRDMSERANFGQFDKSTLNTSHFDAKIFSK